MAEAVRCDEIGRVWCAVELGRVHDLLDGADHYVDVGRSERAWTGSERPLRSR